jgi:pimeloyl-ACP methyl ester carboxylesterase
MTTTLTTDADGQRAARYGRPAIVLVHGAWVDGSGWEGVYTRLRGDGYAVRIVQHPTISLAGDVAATRRVIDDVPGDVILVGHSYGGAVITEAGNHPRVSALVYVAGWAPDAGESVGSLLQDVPPDAPAPPILPPQDGFLLLDRAKFPASFAGDVQPETAAFLADEQVPWGLECLDGAITTAAWRAKPSWYMVATDDRMIAPATQRSMAQRIGATVSESSGSHAVFISRPNVVAELIARAAAETRAAAR